MICDEGHLLKNEKSALNKAVNRIRTLRRIILTGTPLQNNLKEYYEMVNFVKPNLLGTRKEFMNRFVNPISNGQHSDSTERDIRMMKQRSFVLYDLLKVSCPIWRFFALLWSGSYPASFLSGTYQLFLIQIRLIFF